MVLVAIVTMIDRMLRDRLASGKLSGSFFVSAQAHVQTRLFGWIDFGGMQWIVLVVLLGVAAGLLIALQRRIVFWSDPRTIAVMAMIVSATNNLIDRFRFDGVWDYWVFVTAWGGLSFNVADVIILVSIGYLFLVSSKRVRE